MDQLYPCKREFIVEKQLQRRIMKYIKCIPTSLSFYAIINPFLKLRIPANHDKAEDFQQGNCFFYCKISFVLVIRSEICNRFLKN